MRSGLRSGVASVSLRPVAWLGTWLVNTALVGLAVALYLLVRGAVPADSGLFILLILVLQQSFSLTRCGLRVALVASELALVERQARSRARLTPASEPAQTEPVSSSSPA